MKRKLKTRRNLKKKSVKRKPKPKATKKRKLRGGRYLGKGLEACVFTITGAPGQVVRVMHNDLESAQEEADNERDISVILRRIDPRQERFVSCDNYYRTPTAGITGELRADLTTCFSPDPIPDEVYAGRMMECIPVPDKHPWAPEEKAYLLESLRLLHAEDVEHTDINSNNIMFRVLPDGRQVPVLTDWGKSEIGGDVHNDDGWINHVFEWRELNTEEEEMA